MNNEFTRCNNAKTVAELLACGEMSWGAWVEAHGWDVKKAVAAMEHLTVEGDAYFYLIQPEVTDEEDGVWDGGVEYREMDGLVWYVGGDGPSGGSGAKRERQVIADDRFEVC